MITLLNVPLLKNNPETQIMHAAGTPAKPLSSAPLLAIETVYDHMSVALYNGSGLLAQHTSDTAKSQTLTILPYIQQLLEDSNCNLADLSAIAFSCGPGAFSGVRVAASVTQALAWAHTLPVIPTCSLSALAQAYCRSYALSHGTIVCVVDAKMHEVYTATFTVNNGTIYPAEPPQLNCFASAEVWLASKLAQQPVHLLGDGLALLSHNFKLVAPTAEEVVIGGNAGVTHTGSANMVALAQDVAELAWKSQQLGKVVPAHLALPVYLRSEDAWKKKTP